VKKNPDKKRKISELLPNSSKQNHQKKTKDKRKSGSFSTVPSTLNKPKLNEDNLQIQKNKK